MQPVNFVWLERKVKEWGCMQALIDFDGWRKWKDFAAQSDTSKNTSKISSSFSSTAPKSKPNTSLTASSTTNPENRKSINGSNGVILPAAAASKAKKKEDDKEKRKSIREAMSVPVVEEKESGTTSPELDSSGSP